MKVIGMILTIAVLTFGLSQNPLAQSDDLFSGTYTGDTFNLSLEKFPEGYTGSIDFNGQVFPVVSQASGTALTGYFISGNDHFEIAATLTGENLNFSTGGTNYTLTKVAGLQQNIVEQETTQETVTTAPQGSVVISANQQYSAGTVLQSPWTGVSFTVPENHIATYDPEFEGFLMATQDGNSIIAIEASSKAQAVDLGYYAIESLSEFMLGKANFQLMSPISQVGELLSAQVLIDQVVISAAAKQGSAGNAAIVLAYGPEAEQLSQTVANNISFTTPSSDVATWEQKMYGLHAYASSSATDYSSGPTTGSFAGNSKFNYDFCSDGSYRHEYSDISYFSAGTDTGYLIGTVQTGSEGVHQGTWHLVSSLMGDLILILESSEDNLYMHPIAETAEGAVINNRNYAVTQSELCR